MRRGGHFTGGQLAGIHNVAVARVAPVTVHITVLLGLSRHPTVVIVEAHEAIVLLLGVQTIDIDTTIDLLPFFLILLFMARYLDE